MTDKMMTLEQRKQILQFVGDELDALNLLPEAAQRLIDRIEWDKESHAVYRHEIHNFLSKLVDEQFADEEVGSDYGYPSNYVVKSLEKQMDILHKCFPELSLGPTRQFVKEVLPNLMLPEGAEGWFAIPKSEKIAPTYNEALKKVSEVIATFRKFSDESRWGGSVICRHRRTIRMLAKVGENQPGDILIVPAQFGLLHRGKSVGRAREIFSINEFGLGEFEVICMLLTHGARLRAKRNLGVDCVGDILLFGGSNPDYATYFRSFSRELELRMHGIHMPYDFCGSATGFLPL